MPGSRAEFEAVEPSDRSQITTSVGNGVSDGIIVRCCYRGGCRAMIKGCTTAAICFDEPVFTAINAQSHFPVSTIRPIFRSLQGEDVCLTSRGLITVARR